MVGTSIMLVGVGSAAALSPMVATRPALRQRVGLRMEVEAMPASSTNNTKMLLNLQRKCQIRLTAIAMCRV